MSFPYKAVSKFKRNNKRNDFNQSNRVSWAGMFHDPPIPFKEPEPLEAILTREYEILYDSDVGDEILSDADKPEDSRKETPVSSDKRSSELEVKAITPTKKSSHGTKVKNTTKFSATVFSKGTLEQFFIWKRDHLNEVIHGKRATTDARKYQITTHLLAEPYKSRWKKICQRIQSDNKSTFYDESMKLFTASFLHNKHAALIQKKYMKDQLPRKGDAPIQDYIQRVEDMNDYIPQFPQFNDPLSPEELHHIILNAVPQHWLSELIKTNRVFDENYKDLEEYFENCEQYDKSRPKRKFNKSKKNIDSGGDDNNEKETSISNKKSKITSAEDNKSTTPTSTSMSTKSK